jgi:uncharacterized membrane protein YkgB
MQLRSMRLGTAAQRLDSWLVGLMAHCGVSLMRISLGIVFLWFGVLKFFPGLSPAQDLAMRTMQVLTFGLIRPHVSIFVLATWECAIGLGLILGLATRFTLVLLFSQMLGTLTPILLFPSELFSHLYFAPTLEGQYIIKNIVMISAGLTIGGTLRGAAIAAAPAPVASVPLPRVLVFRERTSRGVQRRR